MRLPFGGSLLLGLCVLGVSERGPGGATLAASRHAMQDLTRHQPVVVTVYSDYV